MLSCSSPLWYRTGCCPHRGGEPAGSSGCPPQVRGWGSQPGRLESWWAAGLWLESGLQLERQTGRRLIRFALFIFSLIYALMMRCRRGNTLSTVENNKFINYLWRYLAWLCTAWEWCVRNQAVAHPSTSSPSSSSRGVESDCRGKRGQSGDDRERYYNCALLA